MIGAVQRSFEILEFLARAPERPHGLSEIAEAVGLHASTCARLLQTLVAIGYAEQMGHKKGYLLGPLAYTLSSRGPYRKDLVCRSEPYLKRAAEEVHESFVLAVMRGGRRIVVLEVDGGREVQVRGSVLQNYDPFASATGRLLLAYADETDLKAALRAAGSSAPRLWPEAATETGLRAALERIRAVGQVARSTEEVTGLALPVRERGRVSASLGLHLPTFRYTGEHRLNVERMLKRTAEALSAELSGQRRAE